MGQDPKMFIKPELIDEFKKKCDEIGFTVSITYVDRTYKEQTALFAQGRENLATVNKLRRIAGLYSIKDEENKKNVTWTMNSKHIINLEDQFKENDKSLAFDFCIVKKGKCCWDECIEDYKKCASIGESLGLYSGGNFKKQDWPHLEFKV